MGINVRNLRLDGRLIGTFIINYEPVADFTATPVTGTTPLTVNFTDTSSRNPTSWLWTFGDGTTTSTQNPVKTYTSTGTFNVTLQATNAYGSNTITKTAYITVENVSPIAGFTASPTSGTVPLTVNFTNASTGTNNTYQWAFGDGTTSNSVSPSKTYNTTGTFNVTLTASNSSGVSVTTSTGLITVANVAPIAGFSASPTSGTIPLTVNFTNASTGTNLTYGWNFGDGTTSSSTSPSKTYSNTGSYTVTLTASNSAGSSTSTQSITTSDVSPVAGFSAAPSSGMAPLTVVFTNSSTGTNLTYLWDFKNDGTATTSTASPSYTYSTEGTYSVKLTASNSAGTSTDTKLNLISVSPYIEPNANYTTLLIPGTGTNNGTNPGNSIIDSSPNNYQYFGQQGSVHLNGFTPYVEEPGYWSSYFDGTGDFVQLPSTSTLALGSGDFTVELWVYPTRLAQMGLISNSASAGGGDTQFEIQIYPTTFVPTMLGWNTEFLKSNTAVTANIWNHIAVTRSGTNMAMWLNGNRVATTASANNFSSTNAVMLGRQAASTSTMLNGYLSNVRMIKGSSVYDPASTTITVPTTPLTAVSNTQLLALQSSGFIDNSTNKFAITASGDVKVSQFSPFLPTRTYSMSTVGGSLSFFSHQGYFNVNPGIIPGAGDFTIEFWIYFSSSVSANILNNGSGFQINVSSNTVSISIAGLTFTASAASQSKSWEHFALVRSGSTLWFYRNGVRQGSSQSSSANIGGSIPYLGLTNRLTAILSNFRLIRSAIYTSNNFALPTAPFTSNTLTQVLLNASNATVVDTTGGNLIFTLGNAKVSTAASSGGSLLFDGSSVVQVSNNDTLQMFGGDFTIEGWIMPTSTATTGTIINFSSNAANGNGGYRIDMRPTAPNLRWYYSTGTTFVNTSGDSIRASLATGTTATQNWTHFAICRSGTNIRLYSSTGTTGTLTTTISSVGNPITSTTSEFFIGALDASYTSGGRFYMNDLRVTRGAARYTGSTYNPPTRGSI